MQPDGKRTDLIVHEQEPFNAEPPAALLTEPQTRTDTFYVRNHGGIPTFTDWSLEVTGEVDQPLRLSLDELRQRFEEHHVVATMQCAGNRRAGLIDVRDIPGEDPWGDGATATADWTGCRLADLLVAAGARPTGAHVAFQAPDVSEIPDPPAPYGSSIPLAKALAPEVLLAWAMNGEPLLATHGAPLRVVVPGYIGARSVKWLTGIRVQAEPSDNFFQATAYRVLPPDADPATAGPGDGISLGPIALNSAILVPTNGERVPAGSVTVQGYAVAGGDRTVARVDVSADGGRSWTQAELGRDQGPWAWRQWSIDLQLSAGEAAIVARAWDDTAAQQPADPAGLWNPKGYVNNSWPRLRLQVEG